MTIKTALLASAAAFMFAAPALAQERRTRSDRGARRAAASQQSLSLNPGMTVSRPDGELGSWKAFRTTPKASRN